METKDFIGLGLLFVATIGVVGVTTVSQRAREAAFFLMVAASVMTHKLDINFFSHFWYRGTTRGLEISFVDVLALGVLVSLLVAGRPRQSRWYWPPGLVFLILFFAFACLSVLFSQPRVYGVFELSKLMRGFIFFLAGAFFVRSQRELGILVLALGCGACLEGVLAIKQRVVDEIYRVTGSLEHENSFSMYLCLVSPIFVAAANSTLPKSLRYLSFAAIGFTSLAILLTISRAGIPVFAFVMLSATIACVSWRVTLKKIAVSALIVLAAAAVLYRSWDTLRARYAEATLEQEYLDERVEGRGFYLRLAKAIVEDRPFGVGLNNWSYWVSKTYGPKLGTAYEDYDDLPAAPDRESESGNYAAPAHSLAALTVGELGLPGLVLFAIVWMRWFQMGAHFLWKRTPAAMHRLGVGIFFGMCGVFLQSVTEWTYRQTHIFLMFHLFAGALASLYWLERRAKPTGAARARAPRLQEQVHHEPVAAR